ncbi:hypothetical protein CIK05_01180 [Bdellovibrio sp. qaytius]|nr:hypothetical protein CIK05_01180 [Bdellovibrio sp. qaytius]
MNEEILNLEKRLTEADASKEIDTSYILDELLAPSAIIVGPKGELYDKQFILNAHGPKRVPFEAVIVDELKIETFPDTAIVYSLTTYKTKEQSFKLRFFRVWKKLNNKWQVLGGSTTMVP